MLAYGSIVYSCYFVVSFPIFFHVDEKPGSRWSILQTVAAALSVSMLMLLLLDLLTRFIGHI